MVTYHKWIEKSADLARKKLTRNTTHAAPEFWKFGILCQSEAVLRFEWQHQHSADTQ